jgi:hypothetical protein
VTVSPGRWAASGEPPAAVSWNATASSEWGAGYGADAAADGVANENGNYWQTVQGKAQGAWWQADLGERVPVRGVKIAWARYEDKYHAPPARVIVQVSVTGAEGSWQDVLQIGADRIPRDEAPWDAARAWEYPFPEATPGRFVRLLFPDGDQPGAKYVGYICLGEVEILAPGLTPQVVSIEGAFGKAEVNVGRPSLVQLSLRGPNGLGPQSLLATHGRRPWARGACTYVVGEDGKRYESRRAKPEKVEVTREGARDALRLAGVKLASGGDEPPVASEDWKISAPGDGRQLVWTISRRWQRDFVCVCSGSPGLFFGFDARQKKNSTTSTLWVDPLRIAADSSGLYELVRMPGRVSENHVQTVRDRDSWAIYKLWTNWPAPADLRLAVTGGHLYRRGSYAFLSEAGAVTHASPRQVHRAGEVEEMTVTIGAAEKQSTGYQLAVQLPDRETEQSLAQFYDSVFNGGAVNDQKGFDFGNETDGWYYAGSCWMYGAALAAGVPASAPLSPHPYDASQAFREHLAHVLSTLDDQGRAHFGYNQGGEWVDDNLHTILGFRFYLLHSGDLAFVRGHLPALERMLDYFVRRRNPQGLFQLAAAGAHWYYDAITTSGVNGYYNAFLYKAALDLAEMEHAAGRPEKARDYRALADSIKAAFNHVLWKEDAPGGPRYLDWIDSQGKEVSYFCDLCQWPPIAVGIASPEQARKIVATADARIATLEKEQGYRGYAGLSALWPVPPSLNPHSWQTFGRYMNGGSLLVQTYWEVVARARAGDAAGAAKRLTLFARRAAETHWAGDTAADIHGEMRSGDGEPYLADMVATTAALVHGPLGVQPTWDKLEVAPCLPPAWSEVEADVLYKGRRHHITIKGGKPHVEALEHAVVPPPSWLMDFNLRRTAAESAQTNDVEFRGVYGDSVRLTPGKRSGVYTSPRHDWSEPVRPVVLAVAVDLHGGRGVATVETSADGFQTVRESQRIPLEDGFREYSLSALPTAAPGIRLRFELERAGEAGSPVVDGFRVVGQRSGAPTP